jgi:enolase
VQTAVNKKLTGMVATSTADIDDCLMSLDPSRTVAAVGANVIHATSIACVRAAARASHEQVVSIKTQPSQLEILNF